MAQLIDAPATLKAAGIPPKRIEEFVGRARTGLQTASVAQMISPAGWSEPGQTPDFDEISIVLSGELVADLMGGTFRVTAGQALHVEAGEWVKYSTPGPEGAEYIAVCFPAFAADLVHRDPPSAGDPAMEAP